MQQHPLTDISGCEGPTWELSMSYFLEMLKALSVSLLKDFIKCIAYAFALCMRLNIGPPEISPSSFLETVPVTFCTKDVWQTGLSISIWENCSRLPDGPDIIIPVFRERERGRKEE